MRLSVPRPSPALVIACLALGLVLGGTAWATGLSVPNNSVGTAQLKNGAVTMRKLAPNAVTSRQVKSRSLLRSDFKPGQLPAGPTGPQGPAGPAGTAGPPGLSAVERVETTTASNSSSVKSAQMACPAGKRLLGGGARLNGGEAAVAIQASFPDNDNVYRATGREVVSTAISWSLTVFAVCAAVSG